MSEFISFYINAAKKAESMRSVNPKIKELKDSIAKHKAKKKKAMATYLETDDVDWKDIANEEARYIANEEATLKALRRVEANMTTAINFEKQVREIQEVWNKLCLTPEGRISIIENYIEKIYVYDPEDPDDLDKIRIKVIINSDSEGGYADEVTAEIDFSSFENVGARVTKAMQALIWVPVFCFYFMVFKEFIMLSFMNILRILLAKIFVFLYSFVSIFGGFGGGFEKELPECPDDFKPIVRFAVCSDVHLEGYETQEEFINFKKLFDTVYDYSATQEYKNFDAVVLVGDISTSGMPIEYEMINKVLDEKVREGTKVLTCMGNHEYMSYRDYDASQGTRVFEQEMDREDCEHAVINGYHFIISSYDEDGRSFVKKSRWMDKEIKAAVEDTGDKPVFVFQHPAPFGTIYGSVMWGDISVPTVLKKYPQVVDFSGHSHYPINDPRSIWQSGYTALGCGTMSSYETELDGIPGNYPYDSENAAEFYIVEADAQGNVHIMMYDLVTEQFFPMDYYLTDLADRNFDYSYNKMKRRDESPVFEDGAKVDAYVNENGETVLTFEGATDNFVVESYKVTVSKNGLIPVVSDNFSGKYMYLFEDNNYEVNLGKLESGKKYVANIVALNAYAETSKTLRYEFVAK